MKLFNKVIIVITALLFLNIFFIFNPNNTLAKSNFEIINLNANSPETILDNNIDSQKLLNNALEFIKNRIIFIIKNK